jgi:hypothetical protein
MARIWKERHNGTTPGNGHQSAEGVQRQAGNSRLLPRDDIMVRVASFTFRFSSIAELRSCLGYYAQRTHPTSRIPAKKLAAELGPDWRALRSWEIERWFERLPMYLLEEPKRQKVVAALSKALELVETGNL